MEKIKWSGTIISIQPRTNVWRYRCDNRTHSHIGYNIFLDGIVEGETRQFSVAISERQQQTVGFRISDAACVGARKEQLTKQCGKKTA